jgi:DNA-binding MarR family transcriptional regulator
MPIALRFDCNVRQRTAEGLSMTESIVISRLAKEGPTTTAELARLEGMRPQSMRTTVSALEKMGMVERRPRLHYRAPASGT